MALRCFLAASRRSTDPRVGFVRRRGAAGGAIASCSRFTKRRWAATRFCHWERCSEATITTAPSTNRGAHRFRARALSSAGRAADVAKLKINSTRVSVLLTF